MAKKQEFEKAKALAQEREKLEETIGESETEKPEIEELETEEVEEQEPVPKDISSEFLNMSVNEFLGFLRSQRKESALSITIDWNGNGVWKARRLKAFLEDFDALERGQKRFASIRATEEQKTQEPNVFASGVKWEQIKE